MKDFRDFYPVYLKVSVSHNQMHGSICSHFPVYLKVSVSHFSVYLKVSASHNPVLLRYMHDKTLIIFLTGDRVVG